MGVVIQLDIDGTISHAPAYFRWLSKSHKAAGHTVLVVTARGDTPRNRTRTRRQLAGWRIAYDELVMSPPIEDLNPARVPKGLGWDHQRHLIKLFTAQDRRVDIVYDDSPEVYDLLAGHSPRTKVFRVMPEREDSAEV